MLNYLKHLIFLAVELWINLSICTLYQSHMVRLTPVVYLIWQSSWQPFWIYDNLYMSLTSTNEVLGLYNPCVHANGIDPCQKTIELRSFSCYRGHFGSHIEKPYDLVIKCNFCQHQWTPWPLKPRTRWKNFFLRPKIKWDIVIFLIWRPCWWPSWISQIPQGWQSVTRWIIDLDHFQSQNPWKTTMHQILHTLVTIPPDYNCQQYTHARFVLLAMWKFYNGT